jgi:hypothetical protein
MAKTWNIRWISYWGFGAGLIYGVVDQFFCRISEAHALRADWPHRQAHGRGDGFEARTIHRLLEMDRWRLFRTTSSWQRRGIGVAMPAICWPSR